MGTPEFAVPTLQALLKASNRYQVVGVYTQPDRAVGRGLKMGVSPVKQLAIQSGLSLFQPDSLRAEPEKIKLRSLKPDFILVVAYGQILDQEVLSLPTMACINVHSSLLPKWRGAAPIHWAILGGDQESGVTTQSMSLKLDAGDILLQKKIPLAATETSQSLHDRLMVIGADAAMETLDQFVEGSIKPTPQNEAQVTYAKKLSKEMGILNPNEPAIELDRKIRALNPWPGTTLEVEGMGRLKVLRATLRPDLCEKGQQMGRLYETSGMVLIGTRSGALELLEIQWEGKNRMQVGDFLNGLRGRGKTLPLGIS